MDTKSKSIKYSLVSKVVAGFILCISVLTALGSAYFMLENKEIIYTSNYKETNEYRKHIGRLTHNLVEFATKSTDGGRKDLDKERYSKIDENLTEAINFNYYVRDLTSNKVSYKIPRGLELSDIINNLNTIYISKDSIPGELQYSEDIGSMLNKSPKDIYILINDPLVPGDKIYEIYENYELARNYLLYAIVALVISTLLTIISFGYLVVVLGRKEKDGEVHLTNIDKIYNDVQSLIVLILAWISLFFLFNIPEAFKNEQKVIFVVLVLVIDILIGMVYTFSMIRQYKKGQLIKNTLFYKTIINIFYLLRKAYYKLYSEEIFMPWTIGLLLLYGLINGIMFKKIYPLFLFGKLAIIAFNGMAVYFLIDKLQSLVIIMEASKEISGGNLDYHIDKSKVSKEFQELAHNIGSIQGGLKNAVDEAVKGERMKTDLITNVSHDLKTPLTSIISYVDLLKQEEINNKDANNYIDILQDKSYRLKQLIDDLIEASKVSSGNIIINKEVVNLNELISQASGEYEDRVKEANLEIRINSKKKKTLIYADGRYMWRIIENLISNAIKYSIPKSRIYIDIEEEEGYGVLTIKNISNYPLDLEPEELIERFIRADKSRTSEGTGLGLSIAEDLTVIQDGKFKIEIDGDLFKVVVKIPMV